MEGDQYVLPGFTSDGQKLFLRRSGSIIHSLNAKMRKGGIGGRLSLRSGRDVLAAGIAKPCRYCSKIIKILTMSADHPMPVARGGDPFMIDCICRSCNEIKGELASDEFQKLMVFIRSLAPEGGADLLRRLHAGAFGIRMMAQQRGREFKGRKKKADGARSLDRPNNA